MYVEVVPNRNSPPAILIRESYREGGKVKKRTIANISHWPRAQVDSMRRLLKGERLVSPEDALKIDRSLPHGHVAAVLGTLRRIGLDKVIASKRSQQRDRAVAMVVARIIAPASKLATMRGLQSDTASTSLGETLEVASSDVDDLYGAMDWLLPRQSRIEDALAKRHLKDGVLALYDVTSSYFEGRKCPLAELGYSRDGKKGKLQITIGLLCAKDGCPVAIEVFEGSTGDPKTLASQVEKLRNRFGLASVVLVGDRGMITEARLREDVRPIDGLDWITALRAPAIKKLIADGSIEPTLFDEKDLAEITRHPDYADERLIVCRNPLLAEQRARKRKELLEATERKLDKITSATKRERRPLRGKDKIGQRVGRILNKHKVGKHFSLTIEEDGFHYERNLERIEDEAKLDGFYVVRTSLPKASLTAEEAVTAYKGLSVVERAFRCIKTVDLKLRPIHHWSENRVRSHVFLCMLAYYVEWHMRAALAPILFDDEDKAAAQAERPSVVAPAVRSSSARQKDQSKKAGDGLPVHSFRTLLGDLATITKNHVRYDVENGPSFTRLSTPTPLQLRAFELLDVTVAM